jgi:serine/threonine-protein kinase
VVTKDPAPPSERRKTVPAHVEAAVLTALEKLPADRYASAAEFAAALGDATTQRRAVPTGRSRSPSALPPFRLSAFLTLATLGLGGLLGWLLHRPPAPAPGRPVAFNIPSDSTHQVLGAGAISPDGMTLVYPVAGPTGQQLFVRRLDQVEPHALPGTAGALDAFFSPDGAWVGFMTLTTLSKVRLDGGGVVTLSTVEGGGGGGTWLADKTIVFSPRSGGFRRVRADGGIPEPVAFKDSTLRPTRPKMLPGGRWILFNGEPLERNGNLIGVLELATGAVRTLGEGARATYVRPDRIVFARNDGWLYVQPFDVARGDTNGTAVQIAGATARIGFSGVPDFAVGLDGTIAMVSGSNQRRLMLADRQGHVTTVVEGAGLWAPRFSPDARRIAFGNYTPPAVDADLWLYELQGGTSERLTYEGRDSNDPQWSPDGGSIAFSTNRGGVPKDIYIHSVRGDRPDRLLLSMPGAQWPSDWSRNGRTLVFTNTESSTTGWDIWTVPVDSGAQARPFLATSFAEAGARLSPDGRWIAYTSNETGRSEVYVQSFPVLGNKVIVSSGGGRDPAWRGDGRELYYWQGDQLMAAQLDPTVPLSVRVRAPLFHAAYMVGAHANYDVRADGRQFVVVTDAGRPPDFVIQLNRTGAKAP